MSQGLGVKVAVTLADGSGATLPSAPFTVEWDAPRPNGEREPIHKTETLGPLAPGESKTLYLVLEAFESLPTVTVTSGGEQILKQPISGRQCVGE